MTCKGHRPRQVLAARAAQASGAECRLAYFTRWRARNGLLAIHLALAVAVFAQLVGDVEVVMPVSEHIYCQSVCARKAGWGQARASRAAGRLAQEVRQRAGAGRSALGDLL